MRNLFQRLHDWAAKQRVFARDSRLWMWGLFISLAIAMLGVGDDLPKYGVPEPIVKYVRGFLLLTVAGSAYSMKSPWKSKQERTDREEGNDV